MHTLLFFCPTSSRAQCASRWLISAPKRLILPAPYTVQGFPAEAQLFLPEKHPAADHPSETQLLCVAARTLRRSDDVAAAPTNVKERRKYSGTVRVYLRRHAASFVPSTLYNLPVDALATRGGVSVSPRRCTIGAARRSPRGPAALPMQRRICGRGRVQTLYRIHAFPVLSSIAEAAARRRGGETVAWSSLGARRAYYTALRARIWEDSASSPWLVIREVEMAFGPPFAHLC
ncbi:hypothetical protein C8J57DRAFT_1261408 [Mycena rebaudengoi]|nr:hypothetical protein C8J57DRAFT_1261408 [Mycena rebaudengoi]